MPLPPPENLTATVNTTTGEVELSFDVPFADDVQYLQFEEQGLGKSWIGGPWKTTLLLKGLPKGRSLQFVGTTFNSDFVNGAYSLPSNEVVVTTRPGAVPWVQSVASPTELTVFWGTPEDTGGTFITFYYLKCVPDCGEWRASGAARHLRIPLFGSISSGDHLDLTAENDIGNSSAPASILIRVEKTGLGNFTVSKDASWPSRFLNVSELVIESGATLSLNETGTSVYCTNLTIRGSMIAGSGGLKVVASGSVVIEYGGSLTAQGLSIACAHDFELLEGGYLTIAQDVGCPSGWNKPQLSLVVAGDATFAGYLQISKCANRTVVFDVTGACSTARIALPDHSVFLSAESVLLYSISILLLSVKSRSNVLVSGIVEGFNITVECSGTFHMSGRLDTSESAHNSDLGKGPECATHGGQSSFYLWGDPPAPPYDSLTEPVLPGGGSSGGGVVRIVADAVVVPAGTCPGGTCYINAKGREYTSAGGSIWITANTISGKLSLAASGSAGGRISVTAVDASAFFGQVSVHSRRYSMSGGECVAGETGTVWWNVQSSWKNGVFAIPSGLSIIGLVPTPQQLAQPVWSIEERTALSPAFKGAIEVNNLTIAAGARLSGFNITIVSRVLFLFGTLSVSETSSFTLGSPHGSYKCQAWHAPGYPQAGCSAIAYGDMRAPLLPGSRGSSSLGGGVIRIVADSIVVGVSLMEFWGASGGSVYITAARIAGGKLELDHTARGRFSLVAGDMSALEAFEIYKCSDPTTYFLKPGKDGRFPMVSARYPPSSPPSCSSRVWTEMPTCRLETFSTTFYQRVVIPSGVLVFANHSAGSGGFFDITGQLVTVDPLVASSITVNPGGTFVALQINSTSMATTGVTAGGTLIGGFATPNITHCRFGSIVVASFLSPTNNSQGMTGFRCWSPPLFAASAKAVSVEFATSDGVFVTPFTGAVTHLYLTDLKCNLLSNESTVPAGCDIDTVGNGTCQPSCDVLQCAFSNRDCRSPTLFVSAAGNDSSEQAEEPSSPFYTLQRGMEVSCAGFVECLPLTILADAVSGSLTLDQKISVIYGGFKDIWSNGSQFSMAGSRWKLFNAVLRSVSEITLAEASLLKLVNVTVIGPTTIFVVNSALEMTNVTLINVTISKTFDEAQFAAAATLTRSLLGECPACSRSEDGVPLISFNGGRIAQSTVRSALLSGHVKLRDSQLFKCVFRNVSASMQNVSANGCELDITMGYELSSEGDTHLKSVLAPFGRDSFLKGDFEMQNESTVSTSDSNLRMAFLLGVSADISGSKAKIEISDSVVNRLSQPFRVTKGSYVELQRCQLSNSFTGSDGAVAIVDGAHLSLKQCAFTGNEALNDGGAIAVRNAGTVEIDSTTFSRNSAGNCGGVMSIAGFSFVHIRNGSVFHMNDAFSGGVIHATGGSSVLLEDSGFLDNSVGGESGGVVLAEGAGVNVTVKRCHSASNAAASAGGFCSVSDGAVLEVYNSTFKSDIAALGGVLHAVKSSTVRVHNGSFSKGQAHQGGAAYASFSSAVELSGSSIVSTFAYQGGALFLLENATAVIETSTISLCSSSSSGSAVMLDRFASVEVLDSQLFRNVAGREGTVFVQSSSCVLNRTRLQSNTASSSAGVSLIRKSSLRLIASTIADNASPLSAKDGCGLNSVKSTVTADTETAIHDNTPYNVFCDISSSVSGGAAPLDGHSCQSGILACVKWQALGNTTLYSTLGGGNATLTGQNLLNGADSPVGVEIYVTGLRSQETEMLSESAIQFRSPPLSGLHNPILAFLEGRGAVSACEGSPSTQSVSTLSYAAPVVEEVSPPFLPTAGGRIAVTGSNFGPESGVLKGQVEVRLKGKSPSKEQVIHPCSNLTWISHAELECDIPAGFAPQLTLFLSVNGQEASAPTQQITNPSKPEGVTLEPIATAVCTIQPTIFTIRWSYGFNGGSGVTLYTIQLAGAERKDDPVTFWTRTVLGNATSFKWDGLHPGWRYTASVSAGNIVGNSSASDWSHGVAPASAALDGVLLARPPCAAKMVFFDAVNASTKMLWAKWQWPDSRNGSTIDRFLLVVRNEKNEIAFEGEVDAQSSRYEEDYLVLSKLEIGPLAERHVYFAKVSSHDKSGQSPFSAEMSSMGLVKRPLPPTAVEVPYLSMFPNKEKFEVKWSPSPDGGGLSVGRYRLFYANTASALQALAESEDCGMEGCVEVASLSHVLLEMPAGVWYVVAVAARSCVGDSSVTCVDGKVGPIGNITAPVLLAKPPDQPASPFLELQGRDSILVTWNQPSLNGADLKGYSVSCRRYCRHESLLPSSWRQVYSGEKLSCLLKDIPAGCAEECQVMATNGAGPSDYSPPSERMTQCPPGKHRAACDGGMDCCKPCDVGTFQSLWGQDQCVICPDGYFTLQTGAIQCDSCPARGVRSVNGLPEVLDGNWYNPQLHPEIRSNTSVYPCIRPLSCVVSGSSNTSVSCAAGYKGILCALCDEGYGVQGTECLECTSSGLSWVLIALIALVLGGFMLCSIKRASVQWEDDSNDQNMALCTFKVLINYLQMTSFLEDFSLDWPSAVRSLFAVASSSSSLPINTSFVNCAIKPPFYLRLSLFLFLPAICVAVPALIKYLLSWIAKCRGTEQPRMRGSTMRTAWLVLCFLVYPTVVRQTVRIFPCSESIDGSTYLLENFAVRCDDGMHLLYSILSMLVLLVFCLGFPVGCALILWHHRGRLGDVEVKKTYLFMFNGYKAEKFFWESVILLRKFGIVLIAAMLSGNKHGHQLIAGLFVLVVSLCLQLRFQPYSNALQSLLEEISLIASFLSLMLGQLYVSGGLSDGGKTAITAAIVVLNALVMVWLFAIMLKEAFGKLRSRKKTGDTPAPETNRPGVEMSTINPLMGRMNAAKANGVV